MRRLLIVLGAACAAVLALPATGSAARAAPISCGVSESQPAWIDFADGSVSFWRERFARPGVVVATGGPILAHEARAAGAATVHWDMHLRKRVGTPSQPADVALMEKRADSLFDYAVSVTGCQQPLIALNELWGSWLPMPLTPTAERYRENVLRFVRRLSERGARPALLVSGDPFTGGGRVPGGSRSARSRTSSSRSTRTRTSSGAAAWCAARGACASAIGAGRPSFSRSGSRPRASG